MHSRAEKYVFEKVTTSMGVHVRVLLFVVSAFETKPRFLRGAHLTYSHCSFSCACVLVRKHSRRNARFQCENGNPRKSGGLSTQTLVPMLALSRPRVIGREKKTHICDTGLLPFSE